MSTAVVFLIHLHLLEVIVTSKGSMCKGVCFCEPAIHLYIEARWEAQWTRVLYTSDEDSFICSLARSLIGFDNQNCLIQF